MLHDNRIAFLQGFVRRPGQVASVVPSSRFLERRLVSLADVGRARFVVELGAGTGGTTRALLAALPAGARLLCIELNPYFARLLERHTDPRLIVHEGSAEDLPEILASHGLAAPDVVVSGIPFSTIPAAIGTRIIRSIRAALAPGGCFVAYQLRGVVANLATPLLGAPDVTLELMNIPPVRVFRWHVADAPRTGLAGATTSGVTAPVAYPKNPSCAGNLATLFDRVFSVNAAPAASNSRASSRAPARTPPCCS